MRWVPKPTYSTPPTSVHPASLGCCQGYDVEVDLLWIQLHVLLAHLDSILCTPTKCMHARTVELTSLV